MRALVGSLLLGAFLLPHEPAQAQGQPTPNLLFEPVLLDLITPESTASGTVYTVQELSALPQGQATDLQSWLDSRKTTAITTLDDVAADIAAYEQSIQELEMSGGAFSPQLDQDLLALGTLLQQAGEFSRAQAVLDRSLHINRVNNGLFGMEQIPIVERIIDNHMARGDLVAADAQQEYLLYVQRKHFGDKSVDLLPALTHYAEWNLFAFRARLVAAPPELDANSPLPEQRPDDNSDLMVEFRLNRLIAAHNLYQSIIRIVSGNFGATDSRLLAFEQKLALTNYLYISAYAFDSSPDPMLLPYNSYLMPYDTDEMGRPPLGFRQGRDALERRVAFFANEPGFTPTEKAQAKLDVADWTLLFGRRMSALESYEETWQETAASGVSPEELDAIFNPVIPQEVPSFLAHPYTRRSLDIPEDLALEYKGYIDVEFELSRYGAPSSVSVLSASPTATPALETRLLRNLRSARFRPRIVDGTARDGQTMRIRYYFTY